MKDEGRWKKDETKTINLLVPTLCVGTECPVSCCPTDAPMQSMGARGYSNLSFLDKRVVFKSKIW